MPEQVRPEDVPEDVQPVCGRCQMPAAWNGKAWEHAEAADAAFCQLVMSGG